MFQSEFCNVSYNEQYNVVFVEWKKFCCFDDYRNQGIAQKAIMKAEEIHGSKNWELSTILQEKGNCCLYEKLGYKKTGETLEINDKLTLVFYEK